MFDPAFEKEFGDEIKPEESANPMARSVIALLAKKDFPYALLVAVYRAQNGVETVKFDVDVERPQKLAVQIARRELIAARFRDNLQPDVFALRPDFPADPLHLNLGQEGWPPWLCLDERPWVEVRPRWTALSFLERIRWWLAETSRGELHQNDQPVEPLFAPGMGVIVPRDLLTDKWDDKRILEFHSFHQTAVPATIVLREGKPEKQPIDGFLPIFLDAQPQVMQRLQSAPANIEQLDKLLDSWGINLVNLLRDHLVKLYENERAKLACRPLLLLRVPFLRSDGSPTGQADLKAFSTTAAHDLGQLGIELGVFLDSGDAAQKFGRVARRVPVDTTMRGGNYPTTVLSVYQSFSRQAGELGSGLPLDERAMVLVGAGAIGSHLVEILRRDGFGAWTIVDNDAFLPHNVQRHRLAEPLVGSPKATATAQYLNWVTGSEAETKAVCADVMRDDPDIDAALKAAEIIVDASASIPVARFLSDLKNATARRLSTFFNAAGRDVVLLGEDANRAITLDALEAQYYRAVLERPTLSNHLAETGDGYHYSPSCRSVSFKMPEHQVSMLTGAIAGDIRRHLSEKDATIAIWIGDPTIGLRRDLVQVYPTKRYTLHNWEVVIDHKIVESAVKFRAAALPSETGGILLGTIDVARRQICVVEIVPAPNDSHGSREGFERGVKNLKAIVQDAHKKTAGQVEYIGEWHSHPKGTRPTPSETDVKQLIWLGFERDIEALPAVMMIIGDDENYTISLVIPA